MELPVPTSSFPMIRDWAIETIAVAKSCSRRPFPANIIHRARACTLGVCIYVFYWLPIVDTTII